jgi:dTDP-4-amino-4,6-dideoxygalactose transaminase
VQAAAAAVPRREGIVRFVALDRQHARIEDQLHQTFVRLLDGALPVAEAWAAEELSLPMHPDLRPEEIERVADAVHAAVSARTAGLGDTRC